MKSDLAICLVTDEGYLGPTIMAALSCRRQLAINIDIIIFCVGIDAIQLEQLAFKLTDENICLIDLPPVWRGRYSYSDFREGHINDVTLGRFFMNEYLDSRYQKILYLDGDTLVTGGLDVLLNSDIPSGSIIACADPMSFVRHHSTSLGKDTRRYFSSINIAEDQLYFNAGVLLASRQTWKDMKDLAFEFFVKNTKVCHHHDQTAINIACRERFIPASIRWNYHSSYVYFGARAKSAPEIYHLSGPSKPWVESTWPFINLARAYKPYFEALAKLGIMPKSPKFNTKKTARHLLKCLRLSTIQRGELKQTQAAIAEYEASTTI